MTNDFVLLTAFLLSIAFIIFFTAKVKLNAFYILIAASIGVGVAVNMPPEKIISAMKEGFGNTLASIGLIIVFGTALGAMLEKTGAAYSLADYILRKVGDKNAPLAMSITGFIFGIPIFCDSGFVVLSPLSKSISKRTSISMSVIGIALAVGLYSVHNLIPPHPGATAASGIIGVDIGRVLLIGLLIAFPSTLVGFIWVSYIGKKFHVIPSPSGTIANQDINETRCLPNPLASSIPIFLPILLISVKSVFTFIPGSDKSLFYMVMSFIGDPIIALLLGLITSLFLFTKLDKKNINSTLNEGMANAGVILLITAAGGTFGSILKVSGIGDVIGNSLSSLGIGLLLPFLISAALKTAQGSSTVAIITTASLVMPLLPELNLESGMGRLFAVLAMGSGSMIVSHANDSFFWVVTKFSDLDIDVSLKVLSSATFFMGVTAEVVIIIFSQFYL